MFQIVDAVKVNSAGESGDPPSFVRPEILLGTLNSSNFILTIAISKTIVLITLKGRLNLVQASLGGGHPLRVAK